MGADGHIAIYDWTKTVEWFPELKKDMKLLRLVVGDAYIYDNPFGEGELLVVYWGDNLLEPTFPGFECWWAKEEELVKKLNEVILKAYESQKRVTA